MFDIGGVELFIVAVIALVVVGPRELPALVRGFGRASGFVHRLSDEFRRAMTDLAHEVDQESDPYASLKTKEGLKPGMSPQEITRTIMSNRATSIDNPVDKLADKFVGEKETAGKEEGTG